MVNKTIFFKTIARLMAKSGVQKDYIQRGGQIDSYKLAFTVKMGWYCYQKNCRAFKSQKENFLKFCLNSIKLSEKISIKLFLSNNFQHFLKLFWKMYNSSMFIKFFYRKYYKFCYSLLKKKIAKISYDSSHDHIFNKMKDTNQNLRQHNIKIY